MALWISLAVLHAMLEKKGGREEERRKRGREREEGGRKGKGKVSTDQYLLKNRLQESL